MTYSPARELDTALTLNPEWKRWKRKRGEIDLMCRPWELRDDEDRQGATLDAIEAAVTAAVTAERAAVIAWLDARCDVGDDCAHKLARMIESGAHRG